MGSSGARAVLTHSDQPHLPPIDSCYIRSAPHADPVDPVLAAVRRMHLAARRRDEFITGTAVTCRNRRQAELLGEALGTGHVTLIDEPLAQLRYLRFTGALPAAGSAVLCDLGAAGLTLTLVDCRADTVLGGTHWPGLGGDSYDELLGEWLDRAGVSIDASAARRFREALSSARVVTTGDPRSAGRVVVTRSDLAELGAETVDATATLLRRMTERRTVGPDTVVLLGGCARSPALRARLAERVALPLVYDREPEHVSARGALLFAAQRPTAGHHTAHIRARGQEATPAPPPAVRFKVYAAAAVTIGLCATVAGLLTAQHGTAQPTRDAQIPTDIRETPPGRARFSGW